MWPPIDTINTRSKCLNAVIVLDANFIMKRIYFRRKISLYSHVDEMIYANHSNYTKEGKFWKNIDLYEKIKIGSTELQYPQS